MITLIYILVGLFGAVAGAWMWYDGTLSMSEYPEFSGFHDVTTGKEEVPIMHKCCSCNPHNKSPKTVLTVQVGETIPMTMFPTIDSGYWLVQAWGSTVEIGGVPAPEHPGPMWFQSDHNIVNTGAATGVIALWKMEG